MNSQSPMNDYCNSIFTIPIDSHFCDEQLKYYPFSINASPASTTISSLSGEEDFSKCFAFEPKTIRFTSLLKSSYKIAIKKQKRTYLEELKKALPYGLNM